LTAENWGEFGPAARNAALAELRRRDPAAAMAILQAKFAGESAEARYRLLLLLAKGLSHADLPLLKHIAANDRAPKVQVLVASLLGRLGRSPSAGDEVAELAGFFSVTVKGFFRRSRTIEPLAMKNQAQAQRREALFETFDLASFAKALGMPPEELVAVWPWRVDRGADDGLAVQVLRTGTDDLAELVVDALMQDDDRVNLLRLVPLAARLQPERRASIANRLMETHGCTFETVRLIAGGIARLRDPLATGGGRALLASLHDPETNKAGLATDLYLAGLIASRAGAQLALERLVDAGLLLADPRLDMLRLSAALDDNGAME
jgi:hypothetical protein